MRKGSLHQWEPSLLQWIWNSWGWKIGRLTTELSFVSLLCRKYGILDISGSYRPQQSVTGIDLLFTATLRVRGTVQKLFHISLLSPGTKIQQGVQSWCGLWLLFVSLYCLLRSYFEYQREQDFSPLHIIQSYPLGTGGSSSIV
jgi:hypothetical protein